MVYAYMAYVILVAVIVAETVTIYYLEGDLKSEKKLRRQAEKNLRVLRDRMVNGDPQQELYDLWDSAGIEVKKTKLIPYHEEEVM